MDFRVKKAVSKFLSRYDYNILDMSGDYFDVVLWDNDNEELVFIEVGELYDGEFPVDEINLFKRKQIEKNVCAYFEDNDISDVKIRFDFLRLKRLCGDRALVRYHKDAWSRV